LLRRSSVSRSFRQSVSHFSVNAEATRASNSKNTVMFGQYYLLGRCITCRCGRQPCRRPRSCEGPYRTVMSARMNQDNFSSMFLAEVAEVAGRLPVDKIEQMADGLAAVRSRSGRLFIIGVGGGAGHAGHAVNDFRKLCDIEAYAPTDNVSELTARTNDEGWDTSFEQWLITSRLSEKDALFVFSVGGGSREHQISMNIVRAVELANSVGADIFGIVGKPDGTTAQLATVAIVVDAPPERFTPHVEGFQAVIWHLLVSHPSVAAKIGKWESVTEASP